MNMNFNFLRKKEFIWIIVLVSVFIVLRLPAIHRPYHQDEYKWPMYAYNIEFKPGDVPHPPLTEYIYRMTGKIFNENDFRFTPLIFSVLNLILLYIFVRRRYGFSTAVWVSIFFIFSFYGVLASLMVDTDGAVLPFFFLVSLIFYDLAYKAIDKKRWFFAGVMAIFMMLGFMVKLSSILGSIAIFLDFLIVERNKITKKHFFYLGISVVSFVGLALILLIVSKYIFPGFDLSRNVSYWDTFARGLSSRNFFQTSIQFIKSLLYLSPFLVSLGLISLFPYRKDFSLFHIFIAISLIFYLIIFDFSIGALDRYLALMIIPLCIISGVIISEKIKSVKVIYTSYIFIGVTFLSFATCLQFLDQNVPSLSPMTEWLN